MLITYRDEIGLVSAEVNTDYGISFLDGIAYFTVGNEDCRVPVAAIVEVSKI